MLITVIIISSRTVHGPVSHCDNPRTLGSVLSFSGFLHQMRYTNTYIYPKEIYILTEQQCQNKQTGKQEEFTGFLPHQDILIGSQYIKL